jgi:hypothetical protein
MVTACRFGAAVDGLEVEGGHGPSKLRVNMPSPHGRENCVDGILAGLWGSVAL